MNKINTLDEWDAMVKQAVRRHARGIAMIEDAVLMEIGGALNHLLDKVSVNAEGEVVPLQLERAESLKNAVEHGYFSVV